MKPAKVSCCLKAILYMNTTFKSFYIPHIGTYGISITEALLMAEWIKELNMPDYILSSTLIRASKTVQILSNKTDVEVFSASTFLRTPLALLL